MPNRIARYEDKFNPNCVGDFFTQDGTPTILFEAGYCPGDYCREHTRKYIFKAFKISKRFDDDISSVCGSFNFEINNNKIKEVYIAYGGMAAVPKRAKACEKILKNKPLNLSTFNQAKNSLDKDLSPIGDMRASKEYRLEIAKNLLMKCFVEIDSNKLTRVN